MCTRAVALARDPQRAGVRELPFKDLGRVGDQLGSEADIRLDPQSGRWEGVPGSAPCT